MSGEFASGAGTSENIEVLADYETDILSKINLGDRKLKVVVDGGNGMGGVTGVPIYERFGVRTCQTFHRAGSDFSESSSRPDGRRKFAGHDSRRQRIGRGFGIAFDGDGDRIGVVDENGRIIWGDELMVLLSREILKGKAEFDDYRRGEMLAKSFRRHREARRNSADVESRAFFNQSENEGNRRGTGGRNERTYLFRRPILRF